MVGQGCDETLFGPLRCESQAGYIQLLSLAIAIEPVTDELMRKAGLLCHGSKLETIEDRDDSFDASVWPRSWHGGSEYQNASTATGKELRKPALTESKQVRSTIIFAINFCHLAGHMTLS